jgi:hypothetical protein
VVVDLGVGEVCTDQGQHLALAWVEHAALGTEQGWRGIFAVRGEHPTGDAGVEPGVAGR